MAARPGGKAEDQLVTRGTRLLHCPGTQGATMPKGEQRSNKMTKKPKKDMSPPKQGTSDRPVPPTTTVLAKGKLKNK
jgi:hypothetical protein